MAAEKMMVQAVNVVTAQGTQECVFVNGGYEYEDVRVTVAEGVVSVCAESTGICSLQIVLDAPCKAEDILVLSDAFERGYAEFAWKKPALETRMPWYFLIKQADNIWGVGVKTQPDSMVSWQYGEGQLILCADVRSGKNPVELKGNTLEACTVVMESYQQDVYAAAADFCGKMCDNPIKVNRPVFGGNDWYCNYGDNDFESIRLHAQRIVECCPKDAEKPFMVIDDGWQICHQLEYAYNGGPWLPNARFKDMAKMAQAIADEGAIPGIWFRPLQTVEFVPEEYVLKRNGMEVILDPSVPEVLDIVAQDVTRIREWGYKLIKHDFSTFDIYGKWGFQMNGDFGADAELADKTRTTAQIIKAFYKTIREAAGEDVMIIGCNTISHLSAGMFEIQRTGDDTSGQNWQRTKDYGINTLAFRMAQHDTFYQADADCVGITNQVDWEKNSQWLDVLAKSGTPLFVSIAKDAYSEQVQADLKKAFEKAAKNRIVSRPLDWEETKTPAKWQSVFGEDEYNW